ncbi:MAG TPA: XdhC/CoxI family protein [Ktedonobacterales bacterium]|nr:XdhC/CoxI family protein [Ktedonobacterales bacterium]
MYPEISAALAQGEPVVLLTVVKVYGAAPCAPGAKMLVRSDGSATGTFGGANTDARAREDGLKALASGEAGLLTYHLDPEEGESVGSCGASLEIFAEPLRPEPRLLVAGSGYVAQALARLTAPTGWRVTLLDDRTEFVRAASLPIGVETAIGDLAELLTSHQPDPMTAVVIVTRGHHSDKDALQAALNTTAGYVGMIGSAGKIRQAFRTLLKEGVPAETLRRVYTPIGLDLHAETPDEIALSIAAELLMWRRGGSGGSLRDQQSILAKVLAAGETAEEPEPAVP